MISYIDKYHSLSVPAKAAIWYMICSILQKGIALISTPIFTRLLSPDDYGLFSVYVSWADIIIIFISLRLDFSVFNKGMSKFKFQRDGYVASMQIVTSLTSLLAIIIYLLFSNAISSWTELPFFIMFLILLRCAVFPSYDFWMLRERYEYRYTNFVFVTLGLTLINALVGVVAVIVFSEHAGIARIVTDFAVYFLIGFTLYVVNFKRGFQKARKEHIKFALLFNLPLIPHYLSTYIMNQMDRIMIQKMVGIVETGIYSVAYSAGMMMNIVSSSLINALTPWYYGKLEEGKFVDVKRNFFPLMVVISGLIYMFMLFAPEAMMLLAPKEYYEAIYIVPPLSASIIFSVMYNFFSIPEFYYDANKFSMFASMGAAIINVVANYIFIGLFGYLAAGFTTMLCHMLIAAGHYFYARYVMGKKGMNFFDTKQISFFYILTTIVVVLMCLIYDYVAVRSGIAVIGITILFVYKNKILSIVNDVRNGK